MILKIIGAFNTKDLVFVTSNHACKERY